MGYQRKNDQSYGYCERESWGFGDYVIKKFKLEDKTINIINHEGHVTLEYLFNIDRSIDEQIQLLSDS